MRKEIIGNATLYLGDCLEILLTVGETDHLITDPPYGVGVYLRMRNPDSVGGNRKHKIKYGNSITAMKKGAIGHLATMFDPVSAYASLNVKRWSVVFSDIESCHLWREALVNAGMRYARTGVWLKPDAMPQMTGDRPGVGFEPCTICHSQSAMRWNGGGAAAVWKHGVSRGTERPDHPCPKPLSLMIDLVDKFTDKNETILDPFMGSGTTGVACMNLGRKFIGVEINKKYFEIACERIAQAQKQIRLFA